MLIQSRGNERLLKTVISAERVHLPYRHPHPGRCRISDATLRNRAAVTCLNGRYAHA